MTIVPLSRRMWVAVSILAAWLLPAGVQGDQRDLWMRQEPRSMAALKSEFGDPGMRYAPIALQFWDADLRGVDTEAVSRELLAKGINPGTVFPISGHPSHLGMGYMGLPVDQWLSPEWFDELGRVADLAERAGAFVLFNVENMWPLGCTSSASILAERPELQAQSLSWVRTPVAGPATVELPPALFAVAAQHDSARALRGQWVWHQYLGSTSTIYARTRFELPADRLVESASLRITADNAYVLSLNGHVVGADDSWYSIEDYDVAARLGPGGNVITVRASDVGGEAGLFVCLQIRLDSGESMSVSTDGSWECAPSPEGPWSPARVIAETHAPPWSLPPGGDLLSSTLCIIDPPGRWEAPEGDWIIYSFSMYFHPGVDGGVLNVIEAGTRDALIEHNLEPYASFMGEHLGATIAGALIDTEGDDGWGLPWSDTLVREYEQRYGRDIRLWMPLLIDRDTEGLWPRARCEWFEVETDLYAGLFGALDDWLRARHMLSSLQVWESAITAELLYVGDVFKCNRTAALLGNDALFDAALSVRDFKQVDSIAELEGRRHLVELAGVAGWQMTPALLKQLTNASIAWGVNVFEPHVTYLERRIEAVPYPPNWYTENPWWPYIGQWSAFAQRAAFINAQGRQDPRVLLYYPLESLFALADGSVLAPTGATWVPEAAQIAQAYDAALLALTAAGVEFLTIDRHYLREMSPGAAAGSFTHGAHRFHSLVLPPMVAMSVGDMATIAAFAEGGGSVYLMGDAPRASTERGLADPALDAQVARLVAAPSTRRISEGLDAELARRGTPLAPMVHVLDGGPRPLSLRRIIGGRTFVWLANNTTEERAYPLRIEGAHGRAEVWDCETGDVRATPSTDGPRGAEVDLVLAPLQGIWLSLDPAREPVGVPRSSVEEGGGGGGVSLTRFRARILPAAQPLALAARDRLKQGSRGPHERVVPITEASPAAQWITLPPGEGHAVFSTRVPLFARPVRAVVHTTARETLDLFVNGRPVPHQATFGVPWLVSGVDIAPFLRRGANRLELVVRGAPEGGAEACVLWGEALCRDGSRVLLATDDDWLVGRAGVPPGESPPVLQSGTPALVMQPPSPATLMDVASELLTHGGVECGAVSFADLGLTEFTGYVDYVTSFDWDPAQGDTVLALGDVRHVAEVFVNGGSVGARLWPPYEFDLSEHLVPGENDLTIRVGNLWCNAAMRFDRLGLHKKGWGVRPPTEEEQVSGLLGPVWVRPIHRTGHGLR